MRKIIAFLLATLTILTVIPFTVGAESDVKAEEKLKTEKIEDIGDGELPASCTLVGSPDLPPVMNQGEVGCCVSAAATYMQFTNAVSRYFREFQPDVKFEPTSGDKKYLFSPKWTYDLSGADTALVYNILMENGCITQDIGDFYRHPRSGACLIRNYRRPSQYMTDTTRWNLDKNQMEYAMNYRLKSFNQVWLSRGPYLQNGKIAFTTTNQGRALLDRVKKAVNEGNVVVTGGRVSAWQYSFDGNHRKYYKVEDPGTLGKASDNAVLFSRGDLSGGHQLAVVGYDDNFTVSYKGVKMKGALQIINSWGTGWGNKGYIWVMYDALNEVSEHRELNFYDRVWTIDQFDFVDYKKDLIINQTPEVYLDVQVETQNRESVNILPTIKRVSSNGMHSYLPKVFEYRYFHTTHDVLNGGQYFNFDGKVNGGYAKANFSFSYNRAVRITESTDLDNIDFGVKIEPQQNRNVKVKSIRLKNRFGEVIDEIKLPQGGESIRSTKVYFFEKQIGSTGLKEMEGEGYKIQAINGIYEKGTKIPLNLEKAEGYNYENMVIKDKDGKVLEKDENGNYVFTVGENKDLIVEGIEKIVDKPADTTPDKTDKNENENKKNNDSTIIIIVAVVAAVAVLGTGIGAVVVLKKKKN